MYVRVIINSYSTGKKTFLVLQLWSVLRVHEKFKYNEADKLSSGFHGGFQW